jgi:hypothetical protein
MITVGKRIGCLVVGAVLSLGRAEQAAAEEVWVQPTHFVAPGLASFPWPTTGSGLASFGFAVPDDFATLTTLKVVLIPKNGLSDHFDIYGSVKADGEAAGGGLLSSLGISATLAAGTVQEIDVTALLAGQLEAASAGRDYVSVFFWFPEPPGQQAANVLGLRFGYDALRLQTADIETGAITTPKLADAAVTNAKLVDNSVGTAKVVNNSLLSEDIANGTIGGVDINKSEVQARVASSCPVGSSIRSITSAGEVVCETDTTGVTSYLRTSVTETCIANQYCHRTVTCTNGRFAMGGGLHYDGFGASESSFYQSYPSSDHAWSVSIFNAHDDPVDIVVYVVCATGTTGASAPVPAAAAPVSRQ